MPHGKAVKVETCTTLTALLGTYNEGVREVKSPYEYIFATNHFTLSQEQAILLKVTIGQNSITAFPLLEYKLLL